MKHCETEIIRIAYNAGVADEYQRLTCPDGKIEFSKVCSAIEKYTKTGSVIYDIGCGPGIYTEYLVRKGFYVGCVDLSEKSIAMCNERFPGMYSNHVLFKEVCCASELNWAETESADTILLLGPMYHITNESKRKLIIEQCHRLLKKDGFIICMFMSIFPAIEYENAAKNNILKIEEFQNHIVTTVNFKGFNVPQYRCWPNSAINEFYPMFSHKEIIHIDNVFPEKKKLEFLTPELSALKDFEFSHQYFIVFKKGKIEQ